MRHRARHVAHERQRAADVPQRERLQVRVTCSRRQLLRLLEIFLAARKIGGGRGRVELLALLSCPQAERAEAVEAIRYGVVVTLIAPARQCELMKLACAADLTESGVHHPEAVKNGRSRIVVGMLVE